MKKPLLMTIAIVLASLGSLSTGTESRSRDEQVTKLLIGLAPLDGPGIQYVVVDKDTTIYERSSGLSDVKNKTPLNLDHTMAAFSMTKTLTAIGMLQLVAKDQIGLDDRTSKYIEHPYNSEITIRQLLNHTSGIPNPIPLRWVHLSEKHNTFDENAELAKVLADNPENDGVPGEKYSYSNIGYWLLGKVIEAVTKRNYADYVEKNIFQPLRLLPSEIAFMITDDTHHAKGYLAKFSLMNLAKNFVTDKEVWGEYEANWLHIKDVYVNGPAFGGAVGTARAFSKILQDLLADQSILLDENTKRFLYSRKKARSGKDIDMTLGWHIGTLEGVQYFYKEGGGAGFHCEMRVYPTEGFASVIMVNKTSFNSRKQLSNLDKMFFN